jgi:hypothetical protein
MNNPDAFFSAKVAGVVLDEGLRLPLTVEFIEGKADLPRRFKVQTNGEIIAEQGKLPSEGHFNVRFTDKDGKTVLKEIEFPS